ADGVPAGQEPRHPDLGELERGERRKKVVRLEDEAHVLAPGLRRVFLGKTRDRHAAELHLAARRSKQPREDIEQRRLPRSRRAHEKRELPGAQLDRYFVERLRGDGAGAERLGDVPRANQDRARRHRSTWAVSTLITARRLVMLASRHIASVAALPSAIVSGDSTTVRPAWASARLRVSAIATPAAPPIEARSATCH